MADERTSDELYAAVLMPRYLGDRRIIHSGGRLGGGSDRSAYDASALPFMVEELLSQGAVHMAIDLNSPYYAAVDTLPEAFRKRIWKIDLKNKCTHQIRAVMSPLLEEAGVTMLDHGTFSLDPKVRFMPQWAVVNLCRLHLRSFLLGLQYQLQVGMNWELLMSDLDELDKSCKSSDSRVHIAMFRMIFGAYEKREIREMEMRPASPKQRAEAFHRFVEDTTYKKLSQESRRLGFPAKVERALVSFDRFTNAIVTSSPLRHLVALGTKVIEVATKMPAVNDKFLESLATEEYLPPAISLRTLKARARQAWREAKPPYQPLDGVVESEALGRTVADDTAPYPDDIDDELLG